MLADSSLKKTFWSEAIATAAYLANRSPKVVLAGRTPYELWFKKRPNISNLKIFGCKAYPLVPAKDRQKFDKKSSDCIFVGYYKDPNTYKLWNIKSKKFIRSSDVIFDEDSNNEDKKSSVMLPLDQTDTHRQPPDFQETTDPDDINEFEEANSKSVDESTSTEASMSEVPTSNPYVETNSQNSSSDKLESSITEPKPSTGEVRKSVRTRKIPNKLKDCEHEMMSLSSTLIEPKIYKDATSSANAQDWMEAMDCEYDSIISHDT